MRKSLLLRGAALLLAIAPASPSIWAADRADAASDVIQVIRDFEDGELGQKRPAVVAWNWTPEQKARAAEYSTAEITGGAAVGAKCLKLTISETMPQVGAGYRMVPLGVDYLPPQTDAVRMRVRVLKGIFTLSVGGPTVYFGHSDVLAQAISLSAAAHDEWTTVEFSLNEGLTRNFRRSQWGHRSPVITYTRWIQEPMSIEVAAGSAGEILIDQVELIAKGQGRPYPAIDPESVVVAEKAADFEDPSAMEQAFTVMTNVTDQPKFEGEPQLVRKTWPPPRIARVAEGKQGGHSLEVVMTGTEEVCFAGMKLKGVAGANAIALTMKAEYGLPAEAEVVLDFVVYAAAPGQREAFPWEALRPPVSWRDKPETAFTYYLTPRNEAMRGVSFGMYHARRVVRNGEWSTIVLPLADFMCLYGQGDVEQAFQQQQVLSGDQVFALTFLSYYGQRSAPTRMLVDDVQFVKVPGDAKDMRSFYQPPIVKAAE